MSQTWKSLKHKMKQIYKFQPESLDTSRKTNKKNAFWLPQKDNISFEDTFINLKDIFKCEKCEFSQQQKLLYVIIF